jgi:hypothetical protein
MMALGRLNQQMIKLHDFQIFLFCYLLWYTLLFGWSSYPVSVKPDFSPLIPISLWLPMGGDLDFPLLVALCAAKEAIEATKFYHEFFPQEDQALCLPWKRK